MVECWPTRAISRRTSFSLQPMISSRKWSLSLNNLAKFIFARIPKNLDFGLWLAYNIDIKKNESFVRAAVLP